jgi:hypothetical protein
MSNDTGDTFFLRDSYFGPFRPILVEPAKQPLEVNRMFTKLSMNAFVMVLQLHFLEAKLSKADVLNPELTAGEPPQVIVHCALESEGKGYNGEPKDLNKQIIHMNKGRDFIRYSEFMRICQAAHLDLSTLGKAVPEPGKEIKSIFLRVGALSGKGDYKARNVFRAWAPTGEQFALEDKARAASLLGALNSTPAPSVLGGMLLPEEAAPARTLMSLIEDIKDVPQGVSNELEGEGPTERKPKKKK